MRRIVGGQLVGLVLMAVGLIPLLAIVPTVVLAPVALPMQQAEGTPAPVEHPILVFSLVLAILATVPLFVGSGLLFLAGWDRKAFLRSSSNEVESDQLRVRRERWNLRLERLCLLLGCAAVLSLGASGFLVWRKMAFEYLRHDVPISIQIRAALTPEGYLGRILYLAIPTLVLAFFTVGLRVLLVRPEPLPTEPEQS